MAERIETVWENDLTPAQHAELSAALADIFDTEPGEREQFDGGRSWAGARPEFRLVARDERGIAGHIGFLRRFLRIDDHDQLVAELGLVAVRADLRGDGLGGRLLDASDALLTDLATPFAFLGCKPGAAGFYQRNGWHLVDVVPRYPSNDSPYEVRDAPAITLVKAMAQPLETWPAGKAVEWNGLKL